MAITTLISILEIKSISDCNIDTIDTFGITKVMKTTDIDDKITQILEEKNIDQNLPRKYINLGYRTFS